MFIKKTYSTQEELHNNLQKLYKITLNIVGYQTFFKSYSSKQKVLLLPLMSYVLEDKIQNVVLKNSRNIVLEKNTW